MHWFQLVCFCNHLPTLTVCHFKFSSIYFFYWHFEKAISCSRSPIKGSSRTNVGHYLSGHASIKAKQAFISTFLILWVSVRAHCIDTLTWKNWICRPCREPLVTQSIWIRMKQRPPGLKKCTSFDGHLRKAPEVCHSGFVLHYYRSTVAPKFRQIWLLKIIIFWPQSEKLMDDSQNNGWNHNPSFIFRAEPGLSEHEVLWHVLRGHQHWVKIHKESLISQKTWVSLRWRCNSLKDGLQLPFTWNKTAKLEALKCVSSEHKRLWHWDGKKEGTGLNCCQPEKQINIYQLPEWL